MTTERRHRRHPTELKLRLVEAYLNGEGSLKSIAKAHDITHTLLMIWVDKFRRGDLTEEIDYVERAREAELRKLADQGSSGFANPCSGRLLSTRPQSKRPGLSFTGAGARRAPKRSYAVVRLTLDLGLRGGQIDRCGSMTSRGSAAPTRSGALSG